VAPEHLLTILMVSVPAAVSRRRGGVSRGTPKSVYRPLFLQALSRFAIGDRSSICPTDTVLGPDGSGRGSGISDITWDACDQSQSRAGSDRLPLRSGPRHISADTPLMQRPPLTTDGARALLSIKERRTV